MRDGRWQIAPAPELVPGDAVHVRVGDLIPADLHLVDGKIQLDQSALTGKSLPIEACADAKAFSGTVVTRGEASGLVLTTRGNTNFGKTTELVRYAKTVIRLQTTILSV